MLDSFYDHFGELIPQSIKLSLKNGMVIQCTKVSNDNKITGLLELIGLKYLNRKDMVLFTYLGSRHFDIVIFKKSKVEKVLTGIVKETGMMHRLVI